MEIKSNIYGEGYGSSHTWIRGETLQWGPLRLDYYSAFTDYSCLKCGAKFKHYYHITTSIFQAIKETDIINQCPGYFNV